MAEPGTILRWEHPDQAQRDTGAFVDQFAPSARQLAGRPGEWGVIYTGTEADACKLVASIRSGRGPFRKNPAYVFEAKQRSHKVPGQTGRVHEVFVRCVPQEPPS